MCYHLIIVARSIDALEIVRLIASVHMLGPQIYKKLEPLVGCERSRSL